MPLKRVSSFDGHAGVGASGQIALLSVQLSPACLVALTVCPAEDIPDIYGRLPSDGYDECSGCGSN